MIIIIIIIFYLKNIQIFDLPLSRKVDPFTVFPIPQGDVYGDGKLPAHRLFPH